MKRTPEFPAPLRVGVSGRFVTLSGGKTETITLVAADELRWTERVLSDWQRIEIKPPRLIVRGVVSRLAREKLQVVGVSKIEEESPLFR